MSLISVVVPVYNEEECIRELYDRLSGVLHNNSAYELIFVNDGSRDNSYPLLAALASKDKKVKLLNLSRNFGKEIAMTAGLDRAQGDAIVIIDADLQDPPELISEMIKKWRQGYQVVYAQRISRKGESFLKKLTSDLFYRLFKRLINFEIPQNTGDFRLLDSQAVDAIRQVKDKNRFMKGIFAWIGFKSTEVLYHREPRYKGRTKWGGIKLLGLAIDGITSFSAFPLKISMIIGILVSFFSFAYLLFILVSKLFMGIAVPGYPSLLSTVLFIGGVQFILIGILGEYIGKISSEVKDRPLYLVQEEVNFND
jgi:glycosyltransferase involved in cell wall biosynthesis